MSISTFLLRRVSAFVLLPAMAVFCVLSLRPAVPSNSSTPATAARKEAFGKLPLYFVENRGQADARATYYVQGRDKAIYFTDRGLTFVLSQTAKSEYGTGSVSDLNRAQSGLSGNSGRLPSPDRTGGWPDGLLNQELLQPASFTQNAALNVPNSNRWALKLDFVGARAGAHPEGEAQTEAVISYFKGDSSKWKTGLKTYSRIIYRDLWPGIDLMYAGTVNRMKYSFVVRPGADPNQIKLAYRGASSVTVNESGELEVQTPAGGFSDARPVSFQEVDGKQVEIGTTYLVQNKSSIRNQQWPQPAGAAIAYGFSVGEYDRSRELVIDPVVLIYAGFIGGSGIDGGLGIAVDNTGAAYITGDTASTEATFPDGDGVGAVPGPDATYNGGFFDAFAAKINAAGTALVYAGYIGGSGDDQGRAIAVDTAGNAYVTGLTSSTQATFPVLNGPDLTENGNSDAFLTKINPTGTGLVYSGYIGGAALDIGFGIAVDIVGTAYVVGATESTQATFPDGDGFGSLNGPDNTYNLNRDAFVVAVNSIGTNFNYAGYIGGSNSDQANGIALDRNTNEVFVIGQTGSTEATFPDGDGFGPLAGPDETYNGGANDAFVVKINGDGSLFRYATYIGGSGEDRGFGIAVDGTGAAFVTGDAGSTEATFPDGDGFGAIPGPDATYNGDLDDAFVAKINAAGTALVYAGYIGGNLEEIGFGIAVDALGNAYIAGVTLSAETTFPDGDGFGALTGPDTTYNGAIDAFVAKLNAAGTGLVYATYIGGSGEDQGTAIAVDSVGNAYVTGFTASTQATFPDGDGFGGMSGPDITANGGNDAFVVKISSGIVVNSTADTVAADGFCSLREAIQAANSNNAVNECPAGLAGLDTIEFNIGTGTPTINVLSALPVINEPIFIAGNTGGATRVELNGTGAGSVSGLQVAGGSSTISSLVINRFGLSGIVIFSGNGNTVQNCLLGTSANGQVDLGNGLDGVNVNSANNTIGGTLFRQGNTLSGNGRAGITIGFAAGANNLVQGNSIGLRGNLAGPIGNSMHGVLIDGGANNNTIGGTVPGARNFIAGNVQHGVFINGSGSNNNIVQGNIIGVGDEGDNFGNGGSGVHLASSTANNIIGGTQEDAGNLIGFNAVGVNLPDAGAGNRILGNEIFEHTSLGIDLGAGGVTVNDAGDGDGGPNNLQNFPVLTSAIIAGSEIVIQGTLNSAPGTNFRIEFFSSGSCDTSGNGEGGNFIGFTNVTTDASGNVAFDVTLPNLSNLDEVVTATATDAGNNTSEFSACITVDCVYIFNPETASFSPAGGSGMINLNGIGDCSYTAVSNAPWITITGGGSGGGKGEVSYTVAPNPGATPRSGTITIVGTEFVVSQAANGVVVITDFSGGIPSDWTVLHNGEGTYPDGSPATWTTANPCNRVIPPPFSGTFAIVDASCAGPEAFLDEELIPPAFDATGLGTVYAEFFNRFLGAGAPNNIGDVDVSTDGGDSWPFNALRLQTVNDGVPTPSTQSLNITPFIEGDPANVRIRLHYTGPGTGPAFRTLRPERPDAQEQWWGIDFAIYHYELTPASQIISSSGGLGTVTVATSVAVPSPQGAWMVTSNAAWITPSSGGGTGNGSVGYMVAANPSGTPRTGTITIAGKTFTVTQSGCPLLTINPESLPNGFAGLAYNQMLTATGAVPHTFTVSAGTLPTGLNLSASGLLSGTPTTSGAFTFTVNVTDAMGCIGAREYTVIISGSGGNSLMFYPLPAPVRLLETRQGFSGCTTPGAPISANSTFTLPAETACVGIPASAAAITGNITVVPGNTGGFLTLFPSTAIQPTVANSNFNPFEITNNVFTVGLGADDGAFKIFASATTEVIVDVTGYYAPPGGVAPSGTGGLYFHPLPSPVRLLETRPGFSGCFAPGTPLTGTGNPNADPNLDLEVQGRSPLPSPCSSIPASALVLVGNATSVLPSGQGYLTIYPSGGTRPTVASSNYAGSDVINGPFAVRLGADGKFKVYTFRTTHLVADILGYYSAEAIDANGIGLLFNPLLSPARLLETRPDFPGFPLTGCTRTNAKIQGDLAMATHTQQAAGFCGLPGSAQAVVGNVSVVNSAAAGFLTLFPGNLATAPLVATSNYPTPATFGYNRHYFVGLSPNDGTFKVLTQFTTDLIVDVSGYFAP